MLTFGAARKRAARNREITVASASTIVTVTDEQFPAGMHINVEFPLLSL